MSIANHGPDALAIEIMREGEVVEGLVLEAGTVMVKSPGRPTVPVHTLKLVVSKNDALGKPAIASYSVRGCEEIVETATDVSDRGARVFWADDEDVHLYFIFEPLNSVRCRDLSCEYVRSTPWVASTMDHDDLVETREIVTPYTRVVPSTAPPPVPQAGASAVVQNAPAAVPVTAVAPPPEAPVQVAKKPIAKKPIVIAAIVVGCITFILLLIAGVLAFVTRPHAGSRGHSQ